MSPTRFRLDEILDDAKMSQSELARQSGVSFPTVNKMCRNATAGVTLATLDAIAGVLAIAPGDLIERIPDPQKKRRA